MRLTYYVQNAETLEDVVQLLADASRTGGDPDLAFAIEERLRGNTCSCKGECAECEGAEFCPKCDEVPCPECDKTLECPECADDPVCETDGEVEDLKAELRYEENRSITAEAEVTTYRAALIAWLEAVKCPATAPPGCKCPRCMAARTVGLWAPV